MSPQKSKPMHCFCTGFVYLCSGQIQKVMAKNLLNKYVWLVETIYKAKKISFEEINQSLYPSAPSISGVSLSRKCLVSLSRMRIVVNIATIS